MNDKELYRQKKQSQLDDIEARIENLKEEALQSTANTKSKLYEQIETAQLTLKEAKAKLESFEKANKDEIESHKKDIDETFMAINSRLAMS